MNILIQGKNVLDQHLLPEQANIIQAPTREEYIEIHLEHYSNADISYFAKHAPLNSFSVGLDFSKTPKYLIDESYRATCKEKLHGGLIFNGLIKKSLESHHLTMTEGSIIFPTPKKHHTPKRKVCFLDRDGVLIKDTGYPHGEKDLKFLSLHLELLLKLKEQNFNFIVLTNQSGIGRGYFKEEDYLKTNQAIKEHFAKYDLNFLAWYHCPYHPEGKGKYQKNSIFRKPMPGMVLQACEDYSIDLDQSMMIGDKESDRLFIKLKDFIIG